MRLPYRQRFTLIINELGAAVAGRSDDLQAALRRAVPALTETDNLLNLLANDSHTLQQLTADSNSVITALANNSKQVNRFIVEAGNTARDTAAQDSNLRVSIQSCPGCSSSCGRRWPSSAPPPTPTSRCSPTSTPRPRTSTRCYATCRRSRSLRCRRSSRWARRRSPARPRSRPRTPRSSTSTSSPSPPRSWRRTCRSCCTTSTAAAGRSSPTPAARAARASRGLEALLQYVFIQPLAINTFGPFGHLLAVDAFVNSTCTPYATPSTIASTIKSQGVAAARSCYSVLGPDQPGVNDDRPDEPEGMRARSGRRSCGPEGHPDKRLQAAGLRVGRQPAQASAANGDSGSGTDAGSTGSAATSGGSSSSGGGGSSPSSAASDPASAVQGALGAISSALAAARRPRAAPPRRRLRRRAGRPSSSSTTSWRHENHAPNSPPSPTRS